MAAPDLGAYEAGDWDPTVIRVDRRATGLNNGITWADAFTDLQAALAVAAPGDEIWVAAGTYTPTSGADRGVSFDLKSDVQLYGGFAGCETSREQRDWIVLESTLSADIGLLGDSSDNSHHVVCGADVTNVVVDGFTITGGNANGSCCDRWPAFWGGGLVLQNSGPVTVANVTFAQNAADSSGGGMRDYLSSTTLTNVTFRENRSAMGGGLYSSNSALTNVTFVRNSAESSGGGMAGEGTLTNVSFVQNSARNGGGAWLSDSALTNVVFLENSGGQGGGLYGQLGTLTLTNSVFYQNSGGLGGGFHNGMGQPTLTNVIFFQNSAHAGGGMFNSPDTAGPGSPALTSVTFAQNSASWRGGAIYARGGNLILSNGILWGNAAAESGPAIEDEGLGPAVVSHSLVQGGWAGVGNLDADPLFADVAAGDLRLRPGSPAIDSGIEIAGLTFDADGGPRPLDGDGDGLSQFDMGAYEAGDYTLPTLQAFFDASGHLVVRDINVTGRDNAAERAPGGRWVEPGDPGNHRRRRVLRIGAARRGTEPAGPDALDSVGRGG